MLDILKTFAADCTNGVKTSLFGECYEGGIMGVLGIVIDILTIGIGAAAIVGMIISGIQYMTSSGDPAVMTKAKRRIFEILLGLVGYALIWALMQWLIPGGVLNTSIEP